jgi:hypothetical protein
MPSVPYDIDDFKIGNGPDPNGFLPFSGRVRKTDVAAKEQKRIYEEGLAANALSGQAALFEGANEAAEAANVQRRAANQERLAANALSGQAALFEGANAAAEAANEIAAKEQKRIYEEGLAANALLGHAALFEGANAGAEAANEIAARKKEEAAKLASRGYNSPPPPRTRVKFGPTPTAAAATAQAAAATTVDPALTEKIKKFNETLISIENAIPTLISKKELSNIENRINTISKQIYAVFEKKPDNKTERNTLLAKIKELIEMVKKTKGGLQRGGTRKHRKNLRRTRKNRR